MVKLNLWTDGVETYIAESAEQAMEMQIKMLGESSRIGRWRVREDKGPLKIDLSEQDLGDVEKTHAEWIASNGPGFLCSTEY